MGNKKLILAIVIIVVIIVAIIGISMLVKNKKTGENENEITTNQTTQNVTSQTETVDGTPQGITTTQGGSVSYQTPETPSVGQNLVTFNPDDYAIGDIRQSQ